ncbi:hypothetical protein FXO38_06539 [Capsicum annuum]|nr:hypothetical protein FXO38_06539 [Capsicum annuum]
MANKEIDVVVTNQIESSGNENSGANGEIQKLRKQMIEMHRAWDNRLPPPPVPTDNLEYLSSLPLVHGDSVAYLRRYCNQLKGAGGKEELLMTYFGKSLSGLALEWFVDQDIDKWNSWDDLANEFLK